MVSLRWVSFLSCRLLLLLLVRRHNKKLKIMLYRTDWCLSKFTYGSVRIHCWRCFSYFTYRFFRILLLLLTAQLSHVCCYINIKQCKYNGTFFVTVIFFWNTNSIKINSRNYWYLPWRDGWTHWLESSCADFEDDDKAKLSKVCLSRFIGRPELMTENVHNVECRRQHVMHLRSWHMAWRWRYISRWDK